MDQILLQQQLAFKHKMNNIQTTNTILDDLQHKMQSYFTRNNAIVSSKITEQPPSRFSNTQNDRFNSQNNQNMRKQPISNYLISQNRDEGELNGNYGRVNKNETLQFKLYNNFADKRSQPKQQLLKYSQNKVYQPPLQQQYKNNRQRMSQTTAYGNIKSDNAQIREIRGSTSVTKNRKSNEQFRLLGKSRGLKQKQVQKHPIREQQYEKNTSLDARKNSDAQYQNERKYNQYIRSNNKSVNVSPSSQLAKNYPQTSNSFLHSMQTIQIVMKQSMDTKLRKIKQIEHQIMTENQQKVYLYKVNVRLNQQLKHLQQQQKSNTLEAQKNLQWTIKTLEDDIEKLKKQISKKSNQRKQLRKQEQTLKDGYQTVLNNNRSIMRKDIENYMNKQNQSKQNTQMLKGLMKQLDKLKGVVQAKLKSSSVSQHSKRKVIKSYKN